MQAWLWNLPLAARARLAILLVGVAVLAGCSEAADRAGEQPGSLASLPPPIHDERSVTAAAGAAEGPGAECSDVRPCFDHPFTLSRAALLQATASRTGDANGIALEVLAGETQAAFASVPLGTPTVALEVALDAGAYVLRVHAFRMVNGRYVLDATFLEPPAGPGPCDVGERVALSGGLCAAVVGAPYERDREVSLATHPTDPQTVLVTWRQGEIGGEAHILTGYTTDGGATWRVTTLENRGHDPPGGESLDSYGYDSIAAFGADGTGYVLYGGDRTGAQAFDRLTLAKTRDGATWSYSMVYEGPIGVASPDYPDLAVAPDGKHVFVVTYSVTLAPVSEGVWLWTSDDGGVTWSLPRVILPASALQHHYAPRITAGEDGLVVIATNTISPEPSSEGVSPNDGPTAAWVAISRDGGATFDPPRNVRDYEQGSGIYSKAAGVINDPVALHGKTVSLVYGDEGRFIGYRSPDAGHTWGDPVELGSFGGPAIYTSVASAPDGGVAAMTRYGTEDLFGISLLRWSDAGAVVTTLHEDSLRGAYELGDDYGAIGVARDGAAWIAWAIPGAARVEDVWVARSP